MVESHQYSRREFLSLIKNLGITIAVLYLIGDNISVFAQSNLENRQSPELPSIDTPIFFPSYDDERVGYHLEGSIRDFWRGHNHGLTIGAPITKPTTQTDGAIIQYFESTGLKIDPNTETISFLPIGRQFLEATGNTYHNFVITPAEAREVELVNKYFIAIHGGAEAFGRPLTKPIPLSNNPQDKIQIFENMVLAEYDQIEVPPALTRTYFEYYQPQKQLKWNQGRSSLLWPRETLVLPIGQILQQNGRIVGGEATTIRPEATAYSLDLWGAKQKIIVDTNYYGQRLYAIEGNLIVLEIPISSGRDSTGFFTENTGPEGTTIISWRRVMDYRSPLEGSEYLLPNVPWNMSLRYSPEVLIHGIYWHPNFGRQASHGCINISPLHAHWLYNWTTAQTKVIVRSDVDTSYGGVSTADLQRLSIPPPLFPLADDYHPYA